MRKEVGEQRRKSPPAWRPCVSTESSGQTGKISLSCRIGKSVLCVIGVKREVSDLGQANHVEKCLHLNGVESASMWSNLP